MFKSKHPHIQKSARTINNRCLIFSSPLILLAVLAMGCQAGHETKTQDLAGQASEGLCATSARSLYQIVGEINRQQEESGVIIAQDAQTKVQVQKQLQELLLQKIEAQSNSRDEDLKISLAEKAAELIQILDQDVKALDTDDFETQLARLENGSRITPEYEQLSTKAHALYDEVHQLAQAVELNCPESSNPRPPDASFPTNPAPTPNPTPTPPSNSTPFHLKNGLRWTMATAYQTCESLRVKPVDNFVENVQGIRTNSSGGREYKSIPSIVQTHHYIKGMSYGSSCVDVRKKPLVYDYGGKAIYKNDVLDIFTNSGGGSALGIDCSAFASAAAATAGLLYRKNQTQPVYVRYTTRDFVDPVKSNWSCYSKVAVGPNTTIQPGDLATISGHMVGIDTVEKDPFNLAGITNSSQCNNLNSNDFRFILIQSSAGKGSLGINRYQASDYASAVADMKKLLLGYAKATCLAKFSGKTAVPALSSSMSIIRHAGTQECRAQRVPFVNEQCISSCKEVFEL